MPPLPLRDRVHHDVRFGQCWHQPGSAAKIFHRIADAKVAVRFSYLAADNRLVIGANDLQPVLDALQGHERGLSKNAQR